MTRNSNELFSHTLSQHMPGGRQKRHPTLPGQNLNTGPPKYDVVLLNQPQHSYLT